MIVTDILNLNILPDLKKFKATGDYNSIPNCLKEGLVLLESYSGNANYAEVLYDKFRIHNPQVLARLHYLCGNFAEAENLAQASGDTYLLCEILISRNEVDRAFSLLRDAPFDSLWYYYAGAIYLHKTESAKAISCFEKANALFSQSQQGLPRLMVLANLANAYNQIGNLYKATQVFSELILLTRSLDKKLFPRLCSKLYVDIGFHLMQTGELFKAFRYLKSAEALIGHNRSEEFFRVKVFLGYVLKQMGRYHKAIEILSNHEPSVNYLKVDRLRYLAECYTEVGEYEKSEQLLVKAKSIAGDDKFSAIFLNLATYTNQIQQGLAAEKVFATIETLCHEINDQTSLAFVLGKKACAINDAVLAKEVVDPLKKLGFAVEAHDCQLVVISELIESKRFANALALIERDDFSSFPIQYLKALLFKTVCLLNLEQRELAQTNLRDLQLLAQTRNLSITTAMVSVTQIFTSTDWVELPDLYSKYLQSINLLNPHQLRHVKAFENLFHCKEAMNIARTLSAKKHILIQRQTFEVTINHRSTLKLKEFPVQWNLLYELATATFPLSKEDIVRRVLCRNSYNPLSDDNNVNVTIHRLRTNLKKLLGVDPVLSHRGTYQISSEYKLFVMDINVNPVGSKVS